MNFLKNWVFPILVGLAIAMVIKTFLFSTVRVDGTSMMPNMQNNELVLESKISSYTRGDVIVFDAGKEDPNNGGESKDYVKRIIGIGGDTVRFDGQDLYVNDKKVNQAYLPQESRTTGTAGTFGDKWDLGTLSKSDTWQEKDRNQTTVPENMFFVLGDNRAVSNDSRTIGFIEDQHVLGKVYTPFWNMDEQARANINQQSKQFFAE
jgi:signal peptidase I